MRITGGEAEPDLRAQAARGAKPAHKGEKAATVIAAFALASAPNLFILLVATPSRFPAIGAAARSNASL
jgi:hypothetical protein